jgi:hypothetical protein
MFAEMRRTLLAVVGAGVFAFTLGFSLVWFAVPVSSVFLHFVLSFAFGGIVGYVVAILVGQWVLLRETESMFSQGGDGEFWSDREIREFMDEMEDE